MDERFPANAETMNALMDGLGAAVLVLLARMPKPARDEAARDFARLATAAEMRGEKALESVLMDLNRAARTA